MSGLANPYDSLFDYTASAIADQRISEAGQEGMKAFLEKREPKWRA